MKTYLKPTDPDAFLDMAKKDCPSKAVVNKDMVECHVCLGHGGWNLCINEYGPGKHFKCSCSQCLGWGWVVKGSKDDTCPKHEFRELSRAQCQELNVPHYGKCYHVYSCTLCGHVQSHDTSD